MTLAIVTRRQSPHRYMARKPSCFYCGGKTFDAACTPTVNMFWAHTHDHVFPKSVRKKKGVSSSTVPCCWNCNRIKSTKKPGDFIHQYVDPRRWPMIDWALILKWSGNNPGRVGWMYRSLEMKKEDNSYHRFSNSKESREDILFLARHPWIPKPILDLPIPQALQFALMVEIKNALEAR